MSITPAAPAGPVSLEGRQQAAPFLPSRQTDTAEAARVGFGDPVALRLSADARILTLAKTEDAAADPNDPAALVEERLRAFRDEVQKMLVQRGMNVGEAADAANVLSAAVGEAARRPEIREQLSTLAGRPEQAARVSLVVEEAVIRWDPLSQTFVPSVQRVAVSVDLENGHIVPRGGEADIADPSRRIAVLKLDAVLPLHPGLG